MKTMRISWIAIFFILSVRAAFAAPQLTDEDNRQFANSCFVAVKNYLQPNLLPNEFNLTVGLNGYFTDLKFTKTEYWPADIKKTDDSGALIEATVKISFEHKKGGKKGWTKKTVKHNTNTFKCVSENVKRGEYPRPSFFKVLTEKNSVIYAYEWGIRCKNPLSEHITDLSPRCLNYDGYVEVNDLTKSRNEETFSGSWSENLSVSAINYDW